MHPLLITAWVVAITGVALLLPRKTFRIGAVVMAVAGTLFFLDDIRTHSPWWQFAVDAVIGVSLAYVALRAIFGREHDAA